MSIYRGSHPHFFYASVSYGDPSTLTDERLSIIITNDDRTLVSLRDEQSGEEFPLTKERALELSKDLAAAVRKMP